VAAPGPVRGALAELLARAAQIDGGRLADYIPELARADPDLLGIAVVSVQGRSYAAGDAAVPFTIQSISKPVVYALAVAELGLDEVARHVGFEPSGEPFNAISLDADTGRPANRRSGRGIVPAGPRSRDQNAQPEVDGASPETIGSSPRSPSSSAAGVRNSALRSTSTSPSSIATG